VAVPFAEVLPDGGFWILLAYLVPVLWAGSTFGLRGAVAAAGAAGLVFVLGHATWTNLIDDPSLTFSSAGFGAACAELVAFGLVGAFTGVAREREEVLRVDVAHRNRLLRQDLLRVVQALTNAVEAKDVYTEGHLKRVSDFAVMVAEAMEVRGHELEMVFFGSMLHDIGKIGIPEAILTKQGPLTLEEVRVMQRHAEIGARILQDLDILRDAAPVVLHHQERWDGRRDGKYPGYPAGLRGEAIPIGSRIIAVVDAFDAMTTDRPYRKALSVEEAMGELQREAGKQFDPRVVEVFAGLLAEHPWKAEQVA
jgi:HD-GYP domain-containing protein (c-di-GMP phosphodiesterase class II)